VIPIPYSKTTINLDLNIPSLTPRTFPPLPNIKEAVEKALFEPTHGEGIDKRTTGCKTASIVISDATRKTNSRLFLPIIVDTLISLGIKEINVIVATGTHRPSTEDEKRKLCGDAYNRIEIIDHNCDSQGIHIGTTSRGTPVILNPYLLNADIKILTGVVNFHYFAGFSGGYKSIVPGVAMRETIVKNHRLSITEEGFARGVEVAETEGNPVYEDIVEAGSMVDNTFLFNVIIGEAGIEAIFSGDVLQSHKSACKYLKGTRSVKISELKDAVIVSPGGYPYDINLLQSHKAMVMAERILKPGGTMIVLAECPEGVGSESLQENLLIGNPNKVLQRLKGNYTVNLHSAFALLSKTHKFNTYILTQNIPRDIAKKARINTLVSANEIYDIISSNAVVLPKGSITLPYANNPTNS